MKINIEKNLLDKMLFEKNIKLIQEIKKFEIETVGQIGLGKEFNLQEKEKNVAKVIFNIISKKDNKNLFKLTIERVIIFNYEKETSEEKIEIRNIIDKISEMCFDSIITEGEVILKDAGLENIKLRDN